MKQIRLVAVMLILVLLTTTVAGIVMISDYNSGSSNRENTVIGTISQLSEVYQEGQDTVLKIGDVTLTISILDPGRHLLMVYELDGQNATLEFTVTVEETGKYLTGIFLDGKQLSLQTYDSNILEPIRIRSPNKISEPASKEIFSSVTPSYTYSWWDSVKQITGPTYLIKYHHPDRVYYQIAKWQDVTINGYRASHNQFSQSVSSYLIAGGWAVIFGAIGASFGGPAGALLGGVLGALFGFVTAATLGDEEGCVWWWFSHEFANWFIANAWWLVWNPLGWGATIGAFLAMGYLRVGDFTFIDARGIGNP